MRSNFGTGQHEANVASKEGPMLVSIVTHQQGNAALQLSAAHTSGALRSGAEASAVAWSWVANLRSPHELRYGMGDDSFLVSAAAYLVERPNVNGKFGARQRAGPTPASMAGANG